MVAYYYYQLRTRNLPQLMRYTYCTQAASFPGSSQPFVAYYTLLFVQYVYLNKLWYPVVHAGCDKAGQEPGNETMPQERMKITERVVYPHKQVDMPLRLLIWDSSVVTTSSLRQCTLQHGQYTYNVSETRLPNESEGNNTAM